jgi:hypothetical protein
MCEDAAHADSQLGPVVAQSLRNRLADLRAASSPKDLVVGGPRVIGNGDAEYMILNLRDGYRMLFAPNHVKNPRDNANRIEWAKVSRIKIIEISNDNRHQ